MKQSFLDKHADCFYLGFRVIIGLVFLLHGIMKVQMMSAGTLSLMTLMGLAGVIETIGGILIILGLFTRYVAVISAIEMIFAFVMVHLPKGYSPLANGGEAAVLFFAAFLALIAFGSRKWSLDSKLRK